MLTSGYVIAGWRTRLEHVRGRLRGKLRRRVQRILAARRFAVAADVGAVAAFASARTGEEVRYDDGQPSTGHEQPPTKP